MDNRRRQLSSRYGISLEDYERLLTKQNGKCAVCDTTTPNGGKQFFCVDHCHITGAVRGLLCHSCNVGLGYLKDSLNNTRAAVRYLSGNTFEPFTWCG